MHVKAMLMKHKNKTTLTLSWLRHVPSLKKSDEHTPRNNSARDDKYTLNTF